MRILQVNTNLRPGGIQRHVLDLSDYLRRKGHDVVVAADHGDWAPKEDTADFIHLDLDRIAETGGSLFNRISELLPISRKLRREIKRQGIELVHTHETAPAIIAKLATAGLDIPVLFTYHGSDPNRAPSVARTAKRCADWTISPSRASLDNLIALGLPSTNTRVMGLGVHPLAAVPEKEIENLRQSLLGAKGKYLISSLSRLAHQKGIDMMIEVARKIRDQRDDIIIAVGGHGPFEDLVESWAEVARVTDTIKFLGPVSDVAALLAASDLYLLTSRWEALPISIVEAFRSGLPVVATDCGGVKELVNADVGAILPVGDTNALAKKIIELVDNAELRQKMGQNALDLSEENRFLPEAVHESFETLYQEILGR